MKNFITIYYLASVLEPPLQSKYIFKATIQLRKNITQGNFSF